MNRMTLIQLATLVALAVLGAYHGARAQPSARAETCTLTIAPGTGPVGAGGSCTL